MMYPMGYRACSLARALGLLLLAAMASATFAEEVQRPPWLSEEVVGAAVAIGMTEEQLGPFRASVAEFLQEYSDDVQRIIRRGDAGIETQIQRARSTATRQMDKRMGAFLTEDQMILYQDYRAALLDSLTPE